MKKEIKEKLLNEFENMTNEEYIKLHNLAKSRTNGVNMTIKDLYEKGKFPFTKMTVTKRLADLADEFDANMKCDISAVAFEGSEDVYILYLDFSPYEAFNKTVAVPSFWDENRNPTLTWFESSYYKNGKVELFVQGTDLFEDFFEKKTKYDLQDEFSKETGIWIDLNENYPYQYAEWLEKKILG